jgi:hypothetical protein
MRSKDSFNERGGEAVMLCNFDRSPLKPWLVIMRCLWTSVLKFLYFKINTDTPAGKPELLISLTVGFRGCVKIWGFLDGTTNGNFS